jgi:hypothetical protein
MRAEKKNGPMQIKEMASVRHTEATRKNYKFSEA